MKDLISRSYILHIIDMWMKVPSYSEAERNIMRAFDYEIRTAPSVESWDVVKDILKELEQKEEKLYADHCDATARLRAINKIVDSNQAPKKKVDGIKPLAEMEVSE